MIRISTIFIAICMVLVAASLGLVLYSVAGINGTESAIVALTALTFLILYNAVSMRLRDRTDVGSQIADLSRGTADLARQVAEFGRRLAAVEGRLASANAASADRMQAVAGEISELGGLVKQLAVSVANHDDILSAGVLANKAESEPKESEPKEIPPGAAAANGVTTSLAPPIGTTGKSAASRNEAQVLAAVKAAIEENRLEIYLQPMVTLPQRKVRFYEAVTRMRDENDQIVPAEDFIRVAEAAGLIGRIDHMVMLRCVQVLRRLMVRNKDVGVFCNLAVATLSNPVTFTQCLDFLEANRALAPSLIIEFKQAAFRKLGPTESEPKETPPGVAAANGVTTSLAPSIGTTGKSAASRNEAQVLVAVKAAIEENRLEIYLQPMVTLPQRKVRFYEAVTRMRDENDQIVPAEDFIRVAESAGLIGRIDHMVMLRCVQVLRRLMVRNKDVGVFCNLAAATLGNPVTFTQCLDFLEANRALAPSLIIEFKQAAFRKLGATENEHLAALAQRGYRFSIDHVTDLRIEPRELADRGVRFIKVPAALLLDPKRSSTSDIHPSDLSDLLGRFGIDLIAERIEGERAVVDLLDYDVRFGQGFLFAPPRPVRPEAASANGAVHPNRTQETNGSGKPAIEPARSTGNAALARRAAGPV